jgi:hypothetical protein
MELDSEQYIQEIKAVIFALGKMLVWLGMTKA